MHKLVELGNDELFLEKPIVNNDSMTLSPPKPAP